MLDITMVPCTEQNHNYLHSRMWYVQCTHTRVQVFTRYTSMYEIDAKLKILKVLTKTGYLTGIW